MAPPAAELLRCVLILVLIFPGTIDRLLHIVLSDMVYKTHEALSAISTPPFSYVKPQKSNLRYPLVFSSVSFLAGMGEIILTMYHQFPDYGL